MPAQARRRAAPHALILREALFVGLSRPGSSYPALGERTVREMVALSEQVAPVAVVQSPVGLVLVAVEKDPSHHCAFVLLYRVHCATAFVSVS